MSFYRDASNQWNPPAWIRRGAGGLDPLKITKIQGFLVILVRMPPPPPKITKLPSQLSMFGMFCHYRPASETPLKWRFAGGQMIVPFSCNMNLSFIYLLIKKKKKKKKRCQNRTPSGKTFWIRVCNSISCLLQDNIII